VRYSRQKGLVDQKRLERAVVVVAGVGGLGNPAATYLALAGVGEIRLVDDDVVEESNLNRQFLFTEKDLRKKKVRVAAKRLKELNPGIKVAAYEKIDRNVVEGADVVLDCLDNWSTRRELWALSFSLGVPVVHGAVDGVSGQVAVFFDRGDAAPFGDKQGQSCVVLGAAAGVIGSRMALEALDVLHGRARAKMISFDGRSLQEFPVRGEKWTHILVRVSELWLKSKPTRRKLLGLLSRNVERVAGRPRVEDARLVLRFSPDCLEKLSRVFGVKSLSPALKVGLDELESRFREFSKQVAGRRFRVTVHRSWKGYPKKSPELEKELGAIASEFGRVDLTGYEVNLEVEIHRDGAYLFTRRIPGPGGMPYGSEGKVLVLFSGGIDSPVAAWMMARRGAALELLFLNPLGPVLESRVNAVFDSVSHWFPGARLHVIDIGDEVEKIRSNVKEGSRQTVYKRFMYRVAQEAARRLGCSAIVTGESLGQVSSQTLRSLSVIDGAVGIPVFRPLIGMDKDEIVSLARRIGSFDQSSGIKEFCSIESHSNASPLMKEIEDEEKKLEFDCGAVVSRMREAKSIVTEPLPLPDGGFVVVKLWEGIPKLRHGKKYLFVCKSGNRSAEEALKARKAGFEAYSMDYRTALKKGVLGGPSRG